MPVSHLALNVSNIQEAASFYLAALQPLGYRYIGHQGNSIGFGEKDADFFICQSISGRPSPTHIAFSAVNSLQVRECYVAALNAGGLPSGAPGHRNNDCGCFNAAVEDLDGNTIEFILREPCDAEHPQIAPASSEHSRVLDWQEDVARSGADDAQSMSSWVSKAKSRARTALDLASTTSKSVQSASPPKAGLSRTSTEPAGQGSEYGGKAFVGTLLGAAAGAAFAYAMCQSERENARDEASFIASTRARAERKPGRDNVSAAPSTRSRPLERSMSAKGGRSRSNFEGKSTVSKKSHRNFSTTESMNSSRYPPRSMPRTMQRMLQPTAYNGNDDDQDFQDAISRYTQSRRPMPPRSRTLDAIDYQPSAKSYVSARSKGHDLKRSSTLPVDPPYLLEGPKSSAPSRHTSRRGSIDEEKLQRHDSVVSVQSRHDEASRRSSASKASTTKPAPSSALRERDAYSDAGSKASTVKAPSSHRERGSHHEAGSRTGASKAPSSRRERDAYYEAGSKGGASKAPSSHRGGRDDTASRTSKTRAPSSAAHRARDDASKASTAKPSSRRPSVAAHDTPLPPSRSNSYYSAAAVPVPPSRSNSYHSAASRAGSHVSAARIPMSASRTAGSGSRYTAEAEERPTISDLETVLPEDSISCVSRSPPPTPPLRKSGGGSSRRSEASTVKPAKRGSAATVPVRGSKREEGEGKRGKRSLMSFR